MAPSAMEVDAPSTNKSNMPAPMKASGSLNQFRSDDLTPVIGTEFCDLNIVNDLLNSPEAEQRIRDLAITISERGVVFFRAQDNLTNDLQKKLILRLGELTGRPSTNSLHIHPVLNSTRELGDVDEEISTISSVQRQTLYKDSDYTKQAAVWHSDISFEVAPSDYTSLRLTQLPRTGGDTLWASGYEMFDRVSKPYQKFLETLTATHVGSAFHHMAESGKFELYTKPRGSPDNVGTALQASHPVVRTNPVTGWKSIFPVGSFPARIDGLSRVESQNMLKWFHDMITYGHDLQVRFKWKNENDIGAYY
ncbi:hypothetical protein BP6252_13916 [Coleophoma cylindrospora]|uniref:TauD/TfdA-like domain-containing protein n=1 Tax=Coleophoma cylindrospora TaxID=1849047 RepID=A0A3D8Q5S7_9HELO|nr:hypothetical protein BP6252_13916 [Coleophoma cylindrospora]